MLYLPIEVQRAIADFLDVETCRIDRLIEKKRRLIELLTERRMAVMTAGVSGELTSRDMMPSSLPWISTRSAGWREARLSLVARLGSGHTPSRDHPEWWMDCTIPWITTGEVAQMRSDRIEYIDETREMVSKEGVANSAAVVHPAGTVVLCRTASAGYSAIMAQDMATSQDYATWTCGPLLNPRFLLLCLRVMRQDLLGRLAMGSTHQTIYMPDIESLRVPLPTMREQKEIVDAVWVKLHRLDRASDAIEAQVDRLVEHRQALITGTVTGKDHVTQVAG
jgi:type I restriction enzyme S subunit